MDVRPGSESLAGGSLSASIQTHWHLVEAICRLHLSGLRISDVDDAVQETFERFMHADRDRIRDDAGWLVVVATRVCARIHRRAYTGREVGEQLHMLVDHSDPADAAVEQMSFGELLAELSTVERRVVVMRYLLRLPYEDIGRQLNLSTVNARQIALRARRRLRGALELIDPMDTSSPSA